MQKKERKEAKKEGKWHAEFDFFMECQSDYMQQTVVYVNLKIWGQIKTKGHWYLNGS